MKLDLAIIAALQLCFFAYGAHVFWISRPVFVVGSVDRLEMVFANEVSDAAPEVGWPCGSWPPRPSWR